MIRMTTDSIDPDALRRELFDPAAGGYCAFEGWVRNENEGHEVLRLEYEGYEPVAVVEGEKILAEAARKFPYLHAHCVHRTGMLEIGDCAVWVGVASAHRDEAFKACRYIIDELKHRLPIWKKEHYTNGDSGWVNCERCAEHGSAFLSLMAPFGPLYFGRGAPCRDSWAILSRSPGVSMSTAASSKGIVLTSNCGSRSTLCGKCAARKQDRRSQGSREGRRHDFTVGAAPGINQCPQVARRNQRLISEQQQHGIGNV
jgi:molybdopterin synthase catalytic subunit